MRGDRIKGFMEGRDYDIACKAVRMYAHEHGWSRGEKPTGMFEYEFTMSRNGARDSNSPKLSLSVGYDGGRKSVEMRRKGKWTAIIALKDDGEISFGQFQGESGIDDLIELRELYRRAKMEGVA